MKNQEIIFKVRCCKHSFILFDFLVFERSSTMDNLIGTLDVAESKIGIFQRAILDKEVMQELISI